MLPETILLPSGLNETGPIRRSCPRMVINSSPLAAFHTLIVLSPLPEAIRLPSGLKATELTQSSCPRRVITSAPVAVSHILIVLSPPPETIRLPSGLYDIDQIESPWPDSVISSAPVVASHILIVLSSLHEAIRLPSGLNRAATPPLCPRRVITDWSIIWLRRYHSQPRRSSGHDSNNSWTRCMFASRYLASANWTLFT